MPPSICAFNQINQDDVSIEWVKCDNTLEKAKEIVGELDHADIIVLVSNEIEQRKMQKLLRKYEVRIEPRHADIIIDTGSTYCQEYHHLTNVYLQEKRLLYQDQLQDRVKLTRKKYYLLLDPEKTLRRRILSEKPFYGEAFQMLAIHSSRSVSKLLSGMYSHGFDKHIFKTLYYLEAIDSRGRLTKLGQQMIQLPVDPQISRMLVKHGEAIPCVFYLGAALHLSSELKDWFINESPHHQQWIDTLGDHLSLMSLIQDYCKIPMEEKASWCLQHQVSYELLKSCENLAKDLANRLDMESSYEKSFELREAFLDSFFLQTFVLHEDKIWRFGYHKPILESQHTPEDFPECIVCSKVIVHKRSQIQFMGTTTTIQELQQLVPKYFIARRFTEEFQKKMLG